MEGEDTRMTPDQVKTILALTTGVGAILGIISGTARPLGWLWLTVSGINAVVFLGALIAWLVTFVRRGRNPPK